MPSHRILFALAASLSLHLAAFRTVDLLCRTQEVRSLDPSSLRLDITLRVPTPANDFETVMKDTLAAPSAPNIELKPKPKPKPDHATSATLARAPSPEQKLAEHVFYPPAAVSAGIEGESRLLLTLDERGRIVDVQLAASSGHTMLDEAAMRAAYAMGSLPGQGQREIILPVRFRLQP